MFPIIRRDVAVILTANHKLPYKSGNLIQVSVVWAYRCESAYLFD